MVDFVSLLSHFRGMENEDQHTISGLLRKRESLQRENAECRERMAIIANDIEAIDRVLDAFGYQGELEGRTLRAARIILFYRNELRQFLQGELERAGCPMSTRELAQVICQTEGRNSQDRRLLADVTKRASKALREMRRLGIIKSVEDRGRNFVWVSRDASVRYLGDTPHQRNCGPRLD
jgi:hypothetical protein